MSLKPKPWTQAFPEFADDANPHSPGALPYAYEELPEFTFEEITDPSGTFVSALSSPSLPTCVSSGTGTAVGRLVQVQISADADDGTVIFTNFYSDRVWFGTCEPVV